MPVSCRKRVDAVVFCAMDSLKLARERVFVVEWTASGIGSCCSVNLTLLTLKFCFVYLGGAASARNSSGCKFTQNELFSTTLGTESEYSDVCP